MKDKKIIKYRIDRNRAHAHPHLKSITPYLKKEKKKNSIVVVFPFFLPGGSDHLISSHLLRFQSSMSLLWEKSSTWRWIVRLRRHRLLRHADDQLRNEQVES
ncbi:hypothetical protein AKJ16_DCAP23324 [Drosera capensis]